MSRPLLIADCRLHDAPAEAPPADVLVDRGRIARIDRAGDAGDASPGPDVERLDAGGRTLIPGLIDVHIHGAGGADPLDGTPEAMATMSRTLARLGTTAFLATTVMRPAEGSRHVAVAAGCVGESLGGAALLGLHLEGPFVNLERRGGLLPAGIYPPSRGALDEILALAGGALRMMTIAPELEGSLPVIERLAARGVIAAFGHSAARYEDARAAITAGVSHVTHLYNAMPGLHHRAPGPLLAIFESDVAVELVCDGVHVDPRVVAWTYRLLGGARCVCITDGMRTVGLPDGDYVFNGRPGASRDGTARYADGTLIGTTVGLLEISRRFRRYTGCTLARAVDAASGLPARLLGLEHRKGRVAVGMDADLVLLDADHSAWATLVGGAVVHGATVERSDG